MAYPNVAPPAPVVGAGKAKPTLGPPPPTPYQLAQSRGETNVTNLVNNYRQYGLSGSVTTPLGETYSTPSGRSGSSGSSGRGVASSAASPTDLLSLWNQTGFLDQGSGAPLPPAPPPVAGPSAADRANAEAATYGRAKDKIGQESRASMNALESEMGARGMTDSTFMANGAAGILQQGQRGLSDANRDIAIGDLKRQDDVADQTYQGNIAQRDQNMRYAEAQAQARQAAQDRRQQLLLALFRAQQSNSSSDLPY